MEVLPTTPSFLNMLVRSDALDRFDLTSLKRITYGTEVMPQQTLDRVRRAFPGVLLQQTYGLVGAWACCAPSLARTDPSG